MAHIKKNVNLRGNSTSTPIISENGQIYVGYYDHGNLNDPKSWVEVVNKNKFNEIKIIYDGDPVQASPVVYSDVGETTDYIYFITNSSSGKGYCYSYDDGEVEEEWSKDGAGGNSFDFKDLLQTMDI